MNITMPITCRQRFFFSRLQHTQPNADALPHVQHNAPIIKNSYRQLAKAPRMCPMPYPSKPPAAIPKPLPRYHNPMRLGCCFLVYHMDVISMKDGSEHDSAAPASTRRAASDPKELHAAWIMRKRPHTKMLAPKYFPIGSRCMRKSTTLLIRRSDARQR